MPNLVDTGDRVVGPGKYMRAIVALEDDGKILTRVHIFSHVKLTGFHGGTTASFSDAAGKLLFVTAPFTDFVEGQWMPFLGPSDKWTEREFTLPAAAVGKVDRIDVWVAWTPKPGLFPRLVQEFISGIVPGKTSLEDLVAWIQEKFGKPARTAAGLAATDPLPVRSAKATGLAHANP